MNRNYIDGQEVTPEEVELIRDYRNGYRFIAWHTDDFEQRASEKEEWEEVEEGTLYDRKKFDTALSTMLTKYDVNLGISWDTIDMMLDEYCRYEKEIRLDRP
jgi:hypothetical protein